MTEALTDVQHAMLTARVCEGIDVPKELLDVIIAPIDMITFCSRIGIEAQKARIQIDFVSDPYSRDYGMIKKFTKVA